MQHLNIHLIQHYPLAILIGVGNIHEREALNMNITSFHTQQNRTSMHFQKPLYENSDSKISPYLRVLSALLYSWRL